MQGSMNAGGPQQPAVKAANGTHHHGKHGHHHKHRHGAQRAFGIDLKEHFQKGHKGHKGGHHNGTQGAGQGAQGGHHHHNGTAAAGAQQGGANKGAHFKQNAAHVNPAANNGPCPGCSIPLNNEVGAFASDHIAAGAFALNFLSFLFGAGLLGFSFWKTRPKLLGGSPDLQFYGLRVSLSLFVVSRFFNWIYYAVPNSREVTLGYLIFYLVPLVFLYASETTLVYTFAKTALQPIAASGGFQHSKKLAIGMTSFFGLIAFILWILQAVTLGLEINARADLQDIEALGRALKPEMVFQLLSNIVAFLYGSAFIGIAAWASRKSSAALGANYRMVPRFVMAAGAAWTVRSAFGIILQLVPALAIRRGASSAAINFVLAEPIISALTENYLLLASFGLLLLCFRSHLSGLYVDGALNSEIKEDPYVSQSSMPPP